MVGLLFFLSITLILNVGVIFAAENSTGTSKVKSPTTVAKNTTVKAAGSVKTIKVLIYTGNYAGTGGVSGIKNALNYANTNKVVPNVVFSYATTTTITSSKLSGYNVLVVPGGDGGKYYLNSGSISGSAIKSFVSSGNGYLGICAGAFSASSRTPGYYNGWGVAPNVVTRAVNYEGGVPVTITSAGAQVLGTSGTKTLTHYNGPAMTTSGSAKTFATYADGKTGYKGYAAIVGDYYGKGRSVLSGPHPELTSSVPTFVSKLIYWAAGSSSSSSTPTTTKSLTTSQVASAASNVKAFYDKNKRLPNYVTTPAGQITMPTFFNLLATATAQANSGSSAAISIKSVSTPSSTGTYKKGNIKKSEILTIAQKIKSFIASNGRAPAYVTTSLGKISYKNAVYMFSKIMAFYSTNKRLPNYVAM